MGCVSVNVKYQQNIGVRGQLNGQVFDESAFVRCYCGAYINAVNGLKTFYISFLLLSQLFFH